MFWLVRARGGYWSCDANDLQKEKCGMIGYETDIKNYKLLNLQVVLRPTFMDKLYHRSKAPKIKCDDILNCRPNNYTVKHTV